MHGFPAGKGVGGVGLTRAELLLAFRAVVRYMAVRNDNVALARWRAWVSAQSRRHETHPEPLTVSLGELGLARWQERRRTA